MNNFFRSVAILLIFFSLFISIPVHALKKQSTPQSQPVKQWTVATAKQDAFKNIMFKKDLSIYPAFDPEFKTNKALINKGRTTLPDRHIIIFDDNAYGVVKQSSFDKTFYYYADGKLESIDFKVYPPFVKNISDYNNALLKKTIYPIKTYKYSKQTGELWSVIIEVGNHTSFVFNPDKTFDSKWIGDKCYDANGKVLHGKHR